MCFSHEHSTGAEFFLSLLPLLYVHRAAAERKIECDGKVQRQRLCLHLSWCWFTAHTNTHTASHGRFYFLYQDVNLHNDELLLSEIEKRESSKKKVSFEEPQGFADEDEFYIFFFVSTRLVLH